MDETGRKVERCYTNGSRLWQDARRVGFLRENVMLRRAICALAVLCAASHLTSLRGTAQSPRAMGLVDLLNVPRLADPRLSPDGRDIVFTRAESDWKSGKRITHIWRARIGSTDAVQLTSGADG